MTTPNEPGWASQPLPGEPLEPAPASYAPMPMAEAGPPRSARGGRLAAFSAAAVVLVGGGVATYVAVSSSNSTGGAASPRAAVKRLVADLDHDDLLGVLDDIAPNERTAIATPFTDTVKQLQRNGVVRAGANLKKVDGVDFSATDVTFAPSTVTINDHVQIVELTGGTLRVSADARKLPLTAKFLKAVAPHGLTSAQASTVQTVDIGKEVRASGHAVRIAVQKSGGSWYPSLFYTIADNAVADSGLAEPRAADRVPDVGAASADQAVTTLVKSLVAGDVERALELASPTELGVLHDYGKIIVDKAHYAPAPMTIRKLTFRDTAVRGGTRVSLTSIELSDPSTARGDITVTVDGACIKVQMQGHVQRTCLDQMLSGLGAGGAAIGGGSAGSSGSSGSSSGGGGTIEPGFPAGPTSAQLRAITHLFAGFTDLGVVATRDGGSWYVNPVRSYVGLVPAMLSHLRGDDLLQLIALAR